MKLPFDSCLHSKPPTIRKRRRQRKMMIPFLVFLSMLTTANCQLCERVKGNSWKSLTDILDSSNGFAIVCPFRISGKECPKDNESYKVKEEDLYVMCDSVSQSSLEPSCVIDCPGTHFEVKSGTKLTLDGLTLMGSRNSAVKVQSQGYLTTYNAIFLKNRRQSGNGAAIYAEEGSELSLMYSRFEQCEAHNGGAVFHLGAAVISGNSFIDNRATVSNDNGCRDTLRFISCTLPTISCFVFLSWSTIERRGKFLFHSYDVE